MAKQRGEYYIRQAEKHGFETKWGKGDHCKVYSPDHTSMVIIPQNLKGNGTEHTIIKWFAKFGVILTIIGIIYWFLC